MKINSELIRLAITIILIFGGVFTIHYFRTGDLLVDQMIGASVGAILLLASLVWRKWSKHS